MAAGIGDQYVDGAELAMHLAERLAHRLCVGGVALHHEAAYVADDGFQRFAPPPHQHHVGAVRRHAPGHRRADAGTAAGDEDRLP